MEILAGIGALVLVVVLCLLVFIPIITVHSVLDGYVLKTLWWWFIVPVFHLPSLTLIQAIGVAMVVGLLTRRITFPKNKEDTGADKAGWKQFVEFASELILSPLMMLGIGYVVHLFI